jgi:DNA-binding transcriptional MerR regulator/methylmalonyl-CoA mutase cobalamin-binding subunit
MCETRGTFNTCPDLRLATHAVLDRLTAMNTHPGADKRHPIQVVAKRTGLTVDVLRVWEKRYEVVEPGRSAGGHRLYSDLDVERLGLLNRAVSAGRRISRVAGLPVHDLKALVREDEDAAVHRRREIEQDLSSTPEEHLAACLGAVESLDANRLEKSLMRAAVALSAPVLIEEVLGPLLDGIGDRWEHGQMSPGHEHFASVVIRRVLESLANSVMPGPEAPGLVVATPTGQRHEFGALFVAAAAATQGWRVTYLGTDLPASDIAEVARSTGATAIAVSLVYPAGDPRIGRELVELRAAAGPAVPILAGGRAATSYREEIESVGGRLVSDLQDLYSSLAAMDREAMRA